MKTRQEDIMGDALSRDKLTKINAYWRAANYLSVGQIYLYANPMLKITLLSIGLNQSEIR